MMKTTRKLLLTLCLAGSLAACGSDDSMDPADMDGGIDGGEDAGDAGSDAVVDTGPVVIPEPSNGWESVGSSARIDGITKNDMRPAFRPVWVEGDEGLSIFYESQQQIHARQFDGEDWVPAYSSGEEGLSGLTTNGNSPPAVLRSANGEVVLAALQQGGRGNQLVVLRWDGSEWRRFPVPDQGSTNWSWQVVMSVVDGKLAIAQGVNGDRSTHLIHIWDGDQWEEGPEPPQELYQNGQPNLFATSSGFVAIAQTFDQREGGNETSLVAYELVGNRWQQLEGEHRGGAIIEPISNEEGWLNGYRAFVTGDVLQIQVTVNDRMGMSTTSWLAYEGDEWTASTLMIPANAFVVASLSKGTDVALALVQGTRGQGTDVRVGLVEGDEVDFVDRDSPGGGGISNSAARQSQTPALHIDDDYGLCVAWSESLANGQNSPQWSTSNIRVLCNEGFFD